MELENLKLIYLHQNIEFLTNHKFSCTTYVSFYVIQLCEAAQSEWRVSEINILNMSRQM